MYDFVRKNAFGENNLPLHFVCLCIFLILLIFLIWRYKIWSVAGRVIFSLFCLTILAINMQKLSLNSTVSNGKNKVTYAEAEAYMRDRCDAVNQTLIRKLSVDYDGKTIYMFLTVDDNGHACISGISQFELEILSTDCGPYGQKISAWNAL